MRFLDVLKEINNFKMYSKFPVIGLIADASITKMNYMPAVRARGWLYRVWPAQRGLITRLDMMMTFHR